MPFLFNSAGTRPDTAQKLDAERFRPIGLTPNLNGIAARRTTSDRTLPLPAAARIKHVFAGYLLLEPMSMPPRPPSIEPSSVCLPRPPAALTMLPASLENGKL